MLPDYKGGAYTGRLHSRKAILIPPPQDREHVPKGLHTPQAPSTGMASCSLAMHRPCLQCCMDEEEQSVTNGNPKKFLDDIYNTILYYTVLSYTKSDTNEEV